MSVPSMENARRLLDSALDSELLSDAERRAVARALLADGIAPSAVEAALHVLWDGSDRARSTSCASRREAVRRFLQQLGGGTHAVSGRSLDAANSNEPLHESAVQRELEIVIHWAGNLGRVIGRNAEYGRGVPEPAYFVKSALGQDAMVLTAEVYAPGVTDAPNGGVAPLHAEVVTSLGAAPGASRVVALDPQNHCRRINNNVRALWDITSLVASAPLGRYTYQFRFSLGGASALCVPEQPRTLVIAADTSAVPSDALVESMLMFKVGEVTPARIGWIGTPTVRTAAEKPPQALPAEVAAARGDFVELALQVWAPGVSNRADLSAEEHTLALKQLGVRIESPFFDGASQHFRFAGKAGIHEHDDIARFNLGQYVEALVASGGRAPAAGDYVLTVQAGDKTVGTLLVRWSGT